MKKTILSIGIMLAALAILPSCGNPGQKPASDGKNGATAETAAVKGDTPNYRFINVDTISAKYNLAIDFNEQMIRLQNSLAEEEKRQQQSAQTQVANLEKRAQQAQLLTDADAMRKEIESIQSQYESIQYKAQQKLADAAANAEKTIAQNAQVLQDSITGFLRDFAAEKGYDAIIVNTAAPYYHPSLDITAEVVEGLNARYNKVRK